MNTQIGETIENMVQEYDERALLEELGARASVMTSNHSVAGELNPQVSVNAAHLSLTGDLMDLGSRVWRRVERSLYDLLCGGGADDQKDRESILKQIGGSDAALGAALFAVLTGTFGMAPAIATVVAALLIKRIFVPAGQGVCEFWESKIKT